MPILALKSITCREEFCTLQVTVNSSQIGVFREDFARVLSTVVNTPLRLYFLAKYSWHLMKIKHTQNWYYGTTCKECQAHSGG